MTRPTCARMRPTVFPCVFVLVLIDDFTSREGTFTAGGGMRAVAGHVLTGLDVRIDWELHLRVNGFVGVAF